MADPRKKCQVILGEHAAYRRILRGLPASELEHMVREGEWIPRGEGVTDVNYGAWTIRIRQGSCTIGVLTLFTK